MDVFQPKNYPSRQEVLGVCRVLGLVNVWDLSYPIYHYRILGDTTFTGSVELHQTKAQKNWAPTFPFLREAFQ